MPAGRYAGRVRWGDDGRDQDGGHWRAWKFLPSVAVCCCAEIVQDRTCGSVIAVALLGERGNRVPDRGKFGDLAIELGDVLQRELLPIPARASAVAVELEERPHLLQWKTQIPGAMNEPQRMDIRLTVRAIPVIAAGRRLDDPGLLVEADRLRRNARAGGGLAYRHHLGLHSTLPTFIPVNWKECRRSTYWKVKGLACGIFGRLIHCSIRRQHHRSAAWPIARPTRFATSTRRNWRRRQAIRMSPRCAAAGSSMSPGRSPPIATASSLAATISRRRRTRPSATSRPRSPRSAARRAPSSSSPCSCATWPGRRPTP